MIDKVSIGIIDPTLMLLQSLHLEVQYEGGQLVKLLIQHESVKPQFLNGLIGLLKPSKVDLQIQPEIINGNLIFFFFLAIKANKINKFNFMFLFTVHFNFNWHFMVSHQTAFFFFYCSTSS